MQSVQFAAAVLALGAGTVAFADEPEIVPPGSSPSTENFLGWELGATGETVFEHTRAGLRDPHFGMRVYRDNPVPGTLSPVSDPNAPGSDAVAAQAGGKHLFWDVAFGERLPVVTWYDVNPQHARYARGAQINLEAGVFMLLDFDSQSSGVIDTDFRLGLSADFRPPLPIWEHLSISVGFFHESAHLGDEYVLSAATIQGRAAPTANSTLPYRANPSYEALPVTASVDIPFGNSHFSARVYGGASAYFAARCRTARIRRSGERAPSCAGWPPTARMRTCSRQRMPRSFSAPSPMYSGDPPDSTTTRSPSRGPIDRASAGARSGSRPRTSCWRRDGTTTSARNRARRRS